MTNEPFVPRPFDFFTVCQMLPRIFFTENIFSANWVHFPLLAFEPWLDLDLCYPSVKLLIFARYKLSFRFRHWLLAR